jgi:SAM-dependent methyltransferase
MKKINWKNRVQENGHTGLHYGYAYIFDQLARKKILDNCLSGVVTGSALDYGCGSGDFLPVLAKHFRTVHSVDTCKEVYALVSDIYKGKISKYNYIQLIAVLSSNTKSRCIKMLKEIESKLDVGGRILILDAVKDGEKVDSEQANRSLLDYKELFDTVGLEVTNVTGIYSPFIMGQCKSWDTYRRFCEGVGFPKSIKDAERLCLEKAIEIVTQGNDFLIPLEYSNIYIWLLKRRVENDRY